MPPDIRGRVDRRGLRALALVAALGRLAYGAHKAVLLEAGRGADLVWRIFLQQVYYTAGQVLSLLTIAALSVGIAVLYGAAALLGTMGLGAHVRPLAILILRELIPLVTVLVVIGRSGAAISTELGSMKINRELEVLDSLAINTDYFIVFPRLWGMIAALLVVNLYGFTVALVGGEWLGGVLGLFPQSGAPLVPWDVTGGWDLPGLAVKSVVFGGVVGLLCCHHGLAVQESATEIPKMAARGVMRSIFLCLLLNLLYLTARPPVWPAS